MFRSPARVFAPLALVACAVAILVIVAGRGSGSGSSGSTTTSTTTNTLATKQATRHHKKTYIVKNGDVLSQIAIKTGVPLATIQQLNQNVDAQSLHAGQKLKLAP